MSNDKPRLVTCPDCGNEIDPDCCGCGELREGHSNYSGHPFVPMGCDCLRGLESDSREQ